MKRNISILNKFLTSSYYPVIWVHHCRLKRFIIPHLYRKRKLPMNVKSSYFETFWIKLEGIHQNILRSNATVS